MLSPVNGKAGGARTENLLRRCCGCEGSGQPKGSGRLDKGGCEVRCRTWVSKLSEVAYVVGTGFGAQGRSAGS